MTTFPALMRSPARGNLEDDPALVHAAFAGDEQARHTLILSLQEYLRFWASRFARLFFWASPRLDYEELVSAGNLALVERLDQYLRQGEAPSPLRARLAVCAKYALLRFCITQASLIATPYSSERASIRPTESLDRPLPVPGARPYTLGETLAGPPIRLTREREEGGLMGEDPSHQALYDALDRLPPHYQKVVIRAYLQGETSEQIARDLLARPLTIEQVKRIRKRALATLRRLLGVPPTTTQDPARAERQRAYRERQRAYRRQYRQQKKQQDPAWAERQRAYRRQYRQQKKQQDPAWAERQRAYHRQYWHQRKQQDPAWAERLRLRSRSRKRKRTRTSS
jgi:RNA polymerase sigma factor (sigma-70 family)